LVGDLDGTFDGDGAFDGTLDGDGAFDGDGDLFLFVIILYIVSAL
jgi:hypothetical protein